MSIPPHAGYGRITLLLLSKVIPTMIHDEYLKMIMYIGHICVVTMMSMSTRTNKNAEISRKWHFKLNHQKNNLQCGQSPGDLRSLVMFLLPKILGCRRFHTTLQQMVWGHQMLLVPCIRRPTANSNQQPSRPSKFYRKGEKTQIDAKGCVWGNQHQVKIQGMKLLNRKMALNTCTVAIKLGVYIWMDKRHLSLPWHATNLGVL